MASITRPLPNAATQPGHAFHARPVLVGAIAIIVAASLWQVLQTSDATTTGFAIPRLEQQKAELQAQVHELEAEVAGLSSLDRVDREARGRLGLTQPAETIYLRVDHPAPERQLMPTRYQPPPVDGQVEEIENEPWWRGLARAILPFY